MGLLLLLCGWKQLGIILWEIERILSGNQSFLRIFCSGGRRDACAELLCPYTFCHLCLWSLASVPTVNERVPLTTQFCDVARFTQKRTGNNMSIPGVKVQWNASRFSRGQPAKIPTALCPVLIIWQPDTNMDLLSYT